MERITTSGVGFSNSACLIVWAVATRAYTSPYVEQQEQGLLADLLSLPVSYDDADYHVEGNTGRNHEAGQAQPMQQEWNPSGYLWNVAQPRSVVIAATAPSPDAKVADPEPARPAGYEAACLGCHDDRMMRRQKLTRVQWDREVTKMTGWGAEVKPEHREGILDYLLKLPRP